MARSVNRRKFLQTSAAIGAGYWAAGGIRPRTSRAANEEIRFACIGVNGKGASDNQNMSRLGKIVAICDIDEDSLGKASEKGHNDGAATYTDWRTMLDEMGDSIDAVTVSTPDHSHAPATACALRMGIACYTQKPLTHTISEARLLGRLAREHGVATQMGNQYTAHPNLRLAAATIQSGVLGDVSELHVWTNRPVWPQGLDQLPAEPVPEHVHWDLFLGPASNRPYNQGYHPFKWRGFWDFGTGALGDMACHTLNTPFAALDLRNPLSVQAETSGHNGYSYPSWSIIDFEFGPNEHRPGLSMRWYDGGKMPSPDLAPGHNLDRSGAILIGTKGTLYAAGDYAEKGLNWIGIDLPDIEFERSIGHEREFAEAIRGGPPAMSNFADYAGPLTETILLGNLAVWADGKKVEWDAENMIPTNAPELAGIVRKEYHNGFADYMEGIQV